MSNGVEMLQKTLNSIIFPFLFLFFLFLLYKWIFINSSKPQKLPPSPHPKLPILGHLHKLGMHPHRSLKTLSDKYGELMLIYLGKRPTIVVSSSNIAKEIMKTNDLIFSNRPKFTINYRLFYNSSDVATSPYGEYWRHIKSLFLVHLLNKSKVESFKDIREQETSLLMQKINQKCSIVSNLSEMFIVLTNDVLCRVAFGKKYGEKHQESVGGVDFKEVLEEFVKLLGVNNNIGDFIPWLAWVNRFNGLNERLMKVEKRVDLLLEEIIMQNVDRMNNRTGNNYGDDSEYDESKANKHFVEVLLQVQKDNLAGFPLERDNIKALILDAFAAGTDTTYTVLEWTMTELLRNPLVMKKLQNEVREVGGIKQQITEDDLESMSYLKAVIKETLRLHPPLPLLVPRESTEDIKIKGYEIAAKTLVFVNVWAIQRDPFTWENPEKFNPERFMCCNSKDFKGFDFELIPFGGGRRICPGISFAMVNNELVLANLMHNFNWSLPQGVNGQTLDMSESTGITIHRNTPLLAVATPFFLSVN